MAIWHSHAGIVVDDLEGALSFWRDLLGFREVRRLEARPRGTGTPVDGADLRAVWLRHEDFQIELLDYRDRKQRRLDIGSMDVHSTHLGIFCDDVIGRHRRLADQGIWFRNTPTDWGGGRSVTCYGRDADTNWFELINLPADGRGALPLDEHGIGHSHAGIVVGATEAALPFYVDALGFEHVKATERVPDPGQAVQGTHLDGIHVKVNWLRLGGFQIELVDYVNRKDRVIEMGAMDVHATHLGFYTDDLPREYDRLASQGVWFRDPVRTPDGSPARWAYGRDPDGNWFELLQDPGDVPWATPRP